MSLASAQQHWALLAASVIGLAVLLMVFAHLVLGSRGARLNACLNDLRRREKAAAAADRAVVRATKKLEQLRRRSDSVRPKSIDETREDLADAESLLKIANDQVLVARNQVRKIIVEEFPPKRQQALRKRLLPDEKRDTRPFSMEGG
ncbi:MAG: hypothetical protein GWN47_00690 [Woeseiaceae bacterium]|nr:hypothetical protein [Woeseiaceae bacterium]